ncbi:hypothetical protein MBLNU457_5123t1 [Dothideomycetes sp. NU457]
MSFNVSSLLNPAPAGEEAEKDTRRGSYPPLALPNPYQSPETSRSGDKTDAVFEASVDAVRGLASMSSSSAPAPSHDIVVDSNGHTRESPTAIQKSARRPSLYGESGTKLPKPDESTRKMSSPSLEQYHLQSRSPEAHRTGADGSQDQSRPPTMSQNTAFTLPPLQTIPSQSTDFSQKQEQQSIGQDTSVIVPGSGGHNSAHDLTQAAQFTDTYREPLYTRNEPTTSQIRGADISPSAQTPDTNQTSERRGSFAAVKTEPNTALHDSIPAFVPVQPSASAQPQSQSEETSIMPTTEKTTEEMRGKKRPAPKTVNKKGVARKGGPPAKKRKTEADSAKSKTGGRNLKKGTSASATPFNSSPAPRSHRTASPSQDLEAGMTDGEEEDDQDEPGTPGSDDGIYCICRRADTGTFMIGCDGGCDDWFHGKCVGINEKDKGLIDKYICPNCEEQGRGHTSWKRMCRRQGCRMPARTVVKKGQEMSKYCSDECGVLFMQEEVGKTRGADAGAQRRRKKSGASADLNKLMDDEMGPRGGVISTGELKALVNAVDDYQAFKKLGEGVLSPPETPTKDGTGNAKDHPVLTEAESERIEVILKLKDESRERHALLKDRTKFIGLLKDVANKIASEKSIKPKEMCGYNPRITWSEEEFASWRSTESGKKALSSGKLDSGDASVLQAENEDDQTEPVCTKKRCVRHYEWAKLALDDARNELTVNSDRMRDIEKEEREILERAELRAREIKAGNVGGSVEVHAPTTNGNGYIAADEMEVDTDGVASGGAEKNDEVPVLDADSKEEMSSGLQVQAAGEVDASA